MIPVMLLLLAAPVAAADSPEQPQAMSQFSFHQRIIIRIPRVAPRRTPIPADMPPFWVEKGAPKCLALDHVRGAAITRSDSVDLVMDDGQRMRAKLDEDCPALDFYSGFYLTRTEDGMVCADRDEIRSRAGASCPIERFRRLVAKH